MIVLIGSGGHAKVVLDALFAADIGKEDIEVRDRDPARAAAHILGLSITSALIDSSIAGRLVHVAIGSSEARKRLYEEISAGGGQPHPIRHPRAIISQSAKIGDGAFIAAGAIVGPDARVGLGSIVNHGVAVDHDCVVGAHCHLAPGSVIGGGVSLGDEVLVGAGAVIFPGVSIGSGAVIGAGAVVRRSVGPGETWVGVPAAQMAERNR